tara:strand:- start:745 stop:1098 length:354 start_codon:yes stop_codon:yes gene_type:complete
MKSLRNFLTLAFLLASFSLSAQDSGKQTISIKTSIYCDHCKQCESCGPRIYNQLMDVQGIRKVKIDAETATIDVTYSPSKIEPKAIRDAINAAGFDADGQLAPAESLARLDDCCKKN